jgi:hypothetical protein
MPSFKIEAYNDLKRTYWKRTQKILVSEYDQLLKMTNNNLNGLNKLTDEVAITHPLLGTSIVLCIRVVIFLTEMYNQESDVSHYKIIQLRQLTPRKYTLHLMDSNLRNKVITNLDVMLILKDWLDSWRQLIQKQQKDNNTKDIKDLFTGIDGGINVTSWEQLIVDIDSAKILIDMMSQYIQDKRAKEEEDKNERTGRTRLSRHLSFA